MILWIARGILTIILLGFMWSVYPGYFIHDYFLSTTISSSCTTTSNLPGTAQATQYFVPQLPYLDAIQFAVEYKEEAIQDQIITFVLCEGASDKIIVTRDIPLKDVPYSCYYETAIGKKVNAGKEYYWYLIAPAEETCGFRILYTENIADQAPENSLFIINNAPVSDYAQTVSQYQYYVHPDKVIIIAGYWMSSILVYIVCLEIINRLCKNLTFIHL